jgi:hypothetical protein
MSSQDNSAKPPMPKWLKLFVVVAVAIILLIIRKLLYDAAYNSSSVSQVASPVGSAHSQPNLIGGDQLAYFALAVIIAALAFTLWRGGKRRE